ncbi:MAG: M81 family metallopeptidase [Pirellulaceae bacterium]|nr:M81 family metallopeptidase [Pirellulaceae bacterium]
MRIGLLALLHESNTFIGQPTTREHFQENLLLVGDDVRRELAETHHEVGGFFEGLERESTFESPCRAVPLLAARAVPFGTIEAAAFDALLDLLWRQLDTAGPLDGLLVAPHGATVSQRHPDADGYWLGELRRRVGPRLPIVGTLDPHANLSPRMVASCHALVAYRTNPHLDQRARGVEAARLLVRTLRGEIRPTMAAALPPLAINIERQHTSEPQCRRVYDLADQQLRTPGVLSNSILLGFPYADVAEMGSSALVVTDNQPELAAQLAGQLAQEMWDQRQEFVGRMLDIDEAVERAAQLPGPVCLLDMGDNVGGGSPGDSTHLVRPLLQRDVPSLACLYDPRAVSQAAAAGVGQEVELQIGGQTDRLHGTPLAARFTVLGLYDGKFEERQPRHGGFTHCDQGPTAVVRSGRLTLLVNSRRTPPFSLQQLLSCGLGPQAFQIIVAKGVNAPVAAYEPVCPHLLRVNTPGVTTADMRRLEYAHRRRPMFPFEADTCWRAGEVVAGAAEI